MPRRWICLFASTWCSLVALAENPALEFAGPAPGEAHATQRAQTFTLENHALAATWQQDGKVLRLAALTNKLTGETFPQLGTELFRLTTQTTPPSDDTFPVEISLTPERVIVRATRAGKLLGEIASFPRSDFPGNPRLIRVGKMNLKAEAKDSGGEAGSLGECRILQVTVAPNTTRDFTFKAAANRATVQEFPWTNRSNPFSARIDKGTDSAMSWSPAVALIWEDGQRFLLVGVRDQRGTFNITTAKGEQIIAPHFAEFPQGDLPASSFALQSPPTIQRVAQGFSITARLQHPSGLQAQWSAELYHEANYLRQTLQLSNPQNTQRLYGIEFLDVQIPQTQTIGKVPGCPLAGHGFFFGIEMPGSENQVTAEHARSAFACTLDISPTQTYHFGSVMGIAAEGQLRRGFLRYLELERARPSQPFLHYNGWYDLGYGVDEAKMLQVVQDYDRELVKKRGVPVQAYLIDDGWDVPNQGLWVENPKRFPQGFAGTKSKFAAYNAHLAIWISPLGGYGGANERTAHAQKMGLIPPGAKLDLSYPKYHEWFENRCLELMRTGGVNAFKWDKAGEGVSPHFMALLDVAQHLRHENPQLFINVTVGTWPSPFWLNHIDTTWRNGTADVGWSGKGDDREKWLTFRDGSCWQKFVQASPLYPLNSVMHHGIVHGRAFQGDKVGKSGNNLKNEIRSYFANGASLQELYITPSMMTPTSWDQLAESAKWAHTHADVLRDAHWVGGNPLKLEPYGYAAWNSHEATLMLRNPDDQSRTIELESTAVFDIPTAQKTTLTLKTPYGDQRIKELTIPADHQATVELAPFEVLVFSTR